MAFKPTELPDCLAISKKFERGAIHSTTPESAFAMMGPVLDNMRIHSASFINQIDNTDALTVPQSASEKAKGPVTADGQNILGGEINSNVARNIDKADDSDSSFVETIAGNFGIQNGEGKYSANAIFDSKCIPCGFRIDSLASLSEQVWNGVKNDLSEYLEVWKTTLSNMLGQLNDMLGLFTNTDPFIDLCALIKMFTDFVCLPDIARILAVLMALLARLSFQFAGVFDLIIQLVAPLLVPFLSNFVALLERYIWMIVRPIECIIDSIQGLLAKLDYNILFTNIDSLQKHLNLGGPKLGADLPGNEANHRKHSRPDPRGDYTFRLDKPRLSDDEPSLPWIDGQIPRRDIVDGPGFVEADFNLAGPLSTFIEVENAKNQEAVENAADELAAVRRGGRKIDGANAESIRKHRAKEKAAKDKYDAAIEKRNLTYVGRSRRRLNQGLAGLKSSLIMIIGFLREAMSAIQGFFDYLFDELKKLLGEYVGASGSIIAELISKLALTQMIGIITQIYQNLQSGAICPDDANDIKVEQWIPEQPGMKIWTDDDGQIHIEGDEAEIESAVDTVVKALGVTPGIGDPAAEDKGLAPETASQKLKSLIEFTGDPVLDSEVAKMIDTFTNPVNVVFKCPLQTSVAQSEQINQWIAEVNS